MAALLTGQSAATVARTYNIPKGTVDGWKNGQKNTPLVTLPSTKKQEIGDLLLEYIRLSLQSLQAQVQHFGNAAWLNSQPAGELAILHGVLMDKAIRLLEAIANARTDDQPVAQG